MAQIWGAWRLASVWPGSALGRGIVIQCAEPWRSRWPSSSTGEPRAVVGSVMFDAIFCAAVQGVERFPEACFSCLAELAAVKLIGVLEGQVNRSASSLSLGTAHKGILV